ncbi:MAG: hypothetical protein ACYDCG_05880 [Candidatus Acidiferrales bacterium]
MEMLRFVGLQLTITSMRKLAPFGRGKSSVESMTSSSSTDGSAPAAINNPEPNFVSGRSTEKMKLRKYLFAAFVPTHKDAGSTWNL